MTDSNTDSVPLALPTLYKRGKSTGTLLEWTVWADDNKVYTKHGQVGARLQTTVGNTKHGKNIGRSNATTPQEQATAEANAAFRKRIDRGGYLVSKTDAATHVHSVPMLAHKYEDKIKRGQVKFPVITQPKLNGVRCIAYRQDDGKIVLQSRKLKFYSSCKHIIKALGDLDLRSDLVIDGELYRHGLSLSRISSLVKKYRPNETELIQFHVYDITRLSEQGQDQRKRVIMLNEWFKGIDEVSCIQQVPSELAGDDEVVRKDHNNYVEDGYEGAIIRTLDHTYNFDTRSHGLLKLKDFIDMEFEITSVTNGEGKAQHWPVFTCANPTSTAMKNGKPHKEFTVLPMGDDSEKRAMLLQAPLLIGMQLTVRFHMWTEYHQPEHPRGIVIREDI